MPISTTVLMFILFNVDLIILLILVYLVLRNLGKLYYERKVKILGAKLQTKLVVAFTVLILLPCIILFFFATNFISKGIEFWLKSPVEKNA